jgi:hypothetical protein
MVKKTENNKGQRLSDWEISIYTILRELFALTLLLFLSTVVQAQFVHHVKFGPLNDSPQSFDKIGGGYVSTSLSGRSQTPPYNKNRQRICFTNDDGSHRWLKEIFVDSLGEFNQTIKLKVIDNDIYAFSRFGAGYRVEKNVKVTKLNIEGEILWEKVYPRPHYNEVNNVIITDDSTAFVILGFQWDPTFKDTSANKVFLQKIDTAGNELWFHEFIPPPNMVVFGPLSLQIHPNKDIYFQVMGGNGNSFSSFNEDPYIYVCDSEGQLKRKFEYNNNYIRNKTDYFECIGSEYMKLVDEDKLIAWYCKDDTTIAGWSRPYVDATFFLMDTIGNVLKEQLFEQLWGENFIYDVIELNNGDLLWCGLHRGKLYEDEEPFATGGSSLLRMSKDLKIKWFKKYYLHRSETYFIDMLEQDDEGNITLLADYYKENLTEDWDAAIIQLDSNGCFTPDCRDTDLFNHVTSSRDIRIIDLLKDIQVFPNPASSTITVLASRTFDVVEIVDMKGQLISRVRPQGATIDIYDIPPGIYMLRLRDGTTFVGATKLVVGR